MIGKLFLSAVMFSSLLKPRALFLYGLLLSVAAMAIALYTQFFQGFEPCSLCIFQRICYVVYILLALIAIIHRPRVFGVRVYAFLQIFPALLGLAIALRQVWLQTLPLGQLPSCGPGLNYLLERFELNAVIQLVWAGSSDCAFVSWRFWHLSMAAWSAVVFIVLLILTLIILIKKHKGAS